METWPSSVTPEHEDGAVQRLIEKDQRWHEISENVDTIIDGKGLHVDKGIKPVVIAIKANNLGTTGSCEGHIEWGYPHPWVDVESVFSEAMNRGDHFHDLANKRRNKTISQKELEEYEAICERIITENEIVSQKISKLLGEFYLTGNVPKKDRLCIREQGWSRSRLEPAEIPEELTIGSPEGEALRARIIKDGSLNRYKREMDRFAEFLGRKYYEGE